MLLTPAVILTKFQPLVNDKHNNAELQYLMSSIIGHPAIPPDMVLLSLSPLSAQDARDIGLSGPARQTIELIRSGRESFCSVLRRLWELDPERTIETGDIKLIERLISKLDTSEHAVALLLQYVKMFDCPVDVFRKACSLCPDMPKLIPVALGVKGDLHEFRGTLKKLVQKAADAAAIQLATRLEVAIDEHKLDRILDKQWQKSALAVLKYYEVMLPEAIPALLEQWLGLYLTRPEAYEIAVPLLEAMLPHMKKSLPLQDKLIRVLLFIPMLSATKAAWSRAVSKELLAQTSDLHLRGLVTALQKATKPEHRDRLPTFLPLANDVSFSSFLQLCSQDKELKIKIMPKPTAEEEASYREKYVGRTEVEVCMRDVVYTRFFSCGAVRAHLMGRRGMVFVNNMPCPDNVIIDVKKAELEVIVDIPNTRAELVEMPLEAISPELALLINNYQEHNPERAHDKLDLKLRHQLLQAEIVMTRTWSHKWNFLVQNHPRLFTLATRKLWLRAMLGPERYLGDIMHRKRFKLERDRILDKGVKMFREDADAYLTLELEFVDEPGIGTGVTQEFYSLYCAKLLSALLNEKTDTQSGRKVEWRDVGILVAQAILDERCLDVSRIEPLLKTGANEDKEMREYKKKAQEGIRKGIKRVTLVWPFELGELPPLLMAKDPQIALLPEHGFTQSSPEIAWLRRFLDTERQELPLFLEFCTGSAVTREEEVRITVVPKEGPMGELPSVMTCSAYLKLPRYATYDLLKERLLYAMRESRESFYLS